MSWRDIIRKGHCMASKMDTPCDCSECMKKAKCPHCEGKAPKSECICGSMEKEDKPDYIDIDGDGNKTESMKEAAKDKKGRRRGTVRERLENRKKAERLRDRDRAIERLKGRKRGTGRSAFTSRD